MKKTDFKKPNPLTYKAFYLIAKLFCKFKLNLKIEKNELKGTKGPCVILVNHPSVIDFMPTCVAVKRRATFVISTAFYDTMPVKPLLKSAGVIAKNQFQTSMTDIRRMKDVLDNGFPLILFPAGLMTATGMSTPIPSATGKVVKLFNQDVYVLKIQGSYISNPKWGKGIRKGKVVANLTKLFSKEELKTSRPEDLQQKIYDNLSFDEYEYQKQALVPYKGGECVEGLENVLYQCPHCNEEFKIEANNDVLECTSCGYKVRANKYGLFEQHGEKPLIYDTVSEWVRKIQENARNNLAQKLATLSSHAVIQKIHPKKHKFLPVGECDITLTKEEFLLKGSIDGQEFEKSFSVSTFPTLPFKPGKCFDLQDGREVYRIVLDNPRHTIKWITLLELSHSLSFA